MEEKNTKPVLAQLREMLIGEVLVFPIEKRSSVQSTASKFAVEWNKRFRGESDTKQRIFRIERIA